MTLLPIFLAAGLLYLALRGIRWNELSRILARARWSYLCAALFTVALTYFLRAVRWRVLLSVEQRVPLLHVFWATIAGYLGNSYLPARAGELIRSTMLGRSTRLGTSFVLATALSERLLDGVMLVVTGVATSSTITRLPVEVRQAFFVVGLMGCLGVAGLLLAPRFEKLLLRLFNRLPLRESWSSRLRDVVTRFLSGMRACSQPSRAARFLVFSVIAWLNDALGACLVARSVGFEMTIPQALFVLSALGLSSALPSTPGYLGVYQFVAVSVIPLYGCTEETALAYILLCQLVGYIVITSLGIPMLWFGRRQLQLRLAPDNPKLDVQKS